jgi:hypothetical protein
MSTTKQISELPLGSLVLIGYEFFETSIGHKDQVILHTYPDVEKRVPLETKVQHRGVIGRDNVDLWELVE